MLKKLIQNKRGFSHHFLLPVIAILAVGSIGAYLTFASKAATLCPDGTSYTSSIYNVSEQKKTAGCIGGSLYYSYGAPAKQCGRFEVADIKNVCHKMPWPSFKCFNDPFMGWYYYGNSSYTFGCAPKVESTGGNDNGGNTGGSSTCPSSRPTVAQGSSLSACVKIIQRAVGVSQDGSFGPGTKSAVINYQKKYGLTADGVVGPSTWAKIDGGSTGGGTGGGGSTPPPVSKYCNPHKTVKAGSTGGCVAHAQDLLNKAGFGKLTVDGVYGSATKTAINNLEKKYGLTQNGEITATDWDRLHKAASGGSSTPAPVYKNAHDKAYGCSYPRPTVQSGSNHNCVKYLQWTLNHDMGTDLARDGVFGTNTKDAVLEFQKRYSWTLTADGVVGSKTWAMVDRMTQSFNNEVDRVYNCTEPRQTLYYGDKGGSKANCIKYLQRSLNELVGTDVARDGAYGSATKDAVLKLKAKYPDMPQGEVVSTTSWAKLDALMKAKFPRP